MQNSSEYKNLKQSIEGRTDKKMFTKNANFIRIKKIIKVNRRSNKQKKLTKNANFIRIPSTLIC